MDGAQPLRKLWVHIGYERVSYCAAEPERSGDGAAYENQATVPKLMDANSSFEVSSPNQDRVVVRKLLGRLVTLGV